MDIRDHEGSFCRDTRFDSTATAVDYFPSSSLMVQKGSIDSITGEKDPDFPLKSYWRLDDPVEVINEIDTKLNTIKNKQASVFTITQKKKEIAAVFLMIALVGLNDAAIGGNVNSMQEVYEKSDDEISAVFFFNVAGYLIADLASSFITSRIGLRYSLLLGCCLSSAGCLIISFAPPYPVFVIGLSLLGGGSGTFDSNLTTVVSHHGSPLVMSIFFGMYGCGTVLSPILATLLLDDVKWNVSLRLEPMYYYIPLGLEILLLGAIMPIFANYKPPVDPPQLDLSLAMESIKEHERALADEPKPERGWTKFKRALSMKSVWVGFLLLFIAEGQSNMLTGWICTFLIENRQVELASSRYQLSGYWAGVAAGQIALAFVGSNLDEKTFSLIGLGCAAISACILWLVKNEYVGAFALAFVGLFLGPVTPKIFSMVAARIPPSLKALIMSLLLAVGLVGSCLVPIAFGIVAEHGGLATLPAILTVTCITAAVAWTLVPKIKVKL